MMIAVTAAARIHHDPLDDTCRLLMRLNPSLFHGLAYALLLEAALPVDGHAVSPLATRSRECLLRELRDEVTALWPEFDLVAVQRAAARHGALVTALENPAVRAAAVWVPLLYGMIARLAPEGTLRRCLQKLAEPSPALSPVRDVGPLIAGWRALRCLARPLRLMHELVAGGWCANSGLPTLSCEAAVRRFIVACGARGLRGGLLTLVVRAGLRHEENHWRPATVPATRSPVGVGVSGSGALL